MKKLFVLAIICFWSHFLSAQSNQLLIVADPSEEAKIQEMKRNREEKSASFRTQFGTPSSYYGYDETLRSFFIDNIIPETTPKSSSNSSKKEYVLELNKWISSNKQHLKPEHKNSLITE